MTTVEILRAAREQIVTKGWWRGDFDIAHRIAQPGSSCIANACMDASGSPIGEDRRLLARLLGDEDGAIETIFAWNDAPERTLDDVLALFDRGIAAAEALEQEFAVSPVTEAVAA
jgi:hypothetical protein